MGGFRKGGFSNNRFVLKPDVAIASEVSILSKNSRATTDFHAKKMQHAQLLEDPLPGTPPFAISKYLFWCAWSGKPKWGLSNGGLRRDSAIRAQSSTIVHFCGHFGPLSEGNFHRKMTTIVGNRGQLWTSSLSPHLLSPHFDFPDIVGNVFVPSGMPKVVPQNCVGLLLRRGSGIRKKGAGKRPKSLV